MAPCQDPDSVSAPVPLTSGQLFWWLRRAGIRIRSAPRHISHQVSCFDGCVVPGSGFGQRPGTFHFRSAVLLVAGIRIRRSAPRHLSLQVSCFGGCAVPGSGFGQGPGTFSLQVSCFSGCIVPGSGFGQRPGTFHFRSAVLVVASCPDHDSVIDPTKYHRKSSN